MKFYRCIPGMNRSYIKSDRSDPLLQTPCLVGAGSPTIIAENRQSHKPAPARRQIANLPDRILRTNTKETWFFVSF